MGTLPLSFEQFSPSKRNRTNKQWQNSQISNLSTLWLPSTSPRKNGTNSPESSPRPLDSHWPRLLPALLNSTTNIAVCTLVMKIPTLTLLMSLTHSSANATDSPLDSNMSPTWMLTKSRETLPMMSQFTLSEFVLDDLSKDSVSPPESPRTNVLELSVQPRGTRGESGGQTGHTYDISNKHRLGH